MLLTRWDTPAETVVLQALALAAWGVALIPALHRSRRRGQPHPERLGTTWPYWASRVYFCWRHWPGGYLLSPF